MLPSGLPSTTCIITPIGSRPAYCIWHHTAMRGYGGRVLLLTSVFGLLMTGCGAQAAQAPPSTVTVTATPLAETVTLTVTSTLQPTTPVAPTAAPPAPIGTTQTIPSNTKITVHQVQIPTAVEGIDTTTAGFVWAGVEAELCVAEPNVAVSWNPWSLTDDAGRQYKSVNSLFSQFPQPTYPFAGEPVLPGECARGWIMFEVPSDGSITKVRYANTNTDGTSNVLQWTAT